MDGDIGNKIHSSFIPKDAPAAPRAARGGGMGFIFFISLVVLVISLAAWGGAFAYVDILDGDVKKLNSSLATARESFNPGLLEKFENDDRRLKSANEVLGGHTTLVPFFRLLDELTLQSVRFTEFRYAEEDGDRVVKMSGEALGFPSIALQAKSFGGDNRIINPIFANLGVASNNLVTFDVSFSLAPALVLYSVQPELVPLPDLVIPSDPSFPTDSSQFNDETQ